MTEEKTISETEDKEENNFINEVKFNSNFPPFKGGNKIFFGGKNEVKNLIEFYLKDKPEDSYAGTADENANRFKINCVLGNNGGGKSRLFEGIFESRLYRQSDDSNEIMSEMEGKSNKDFSLNDGNFNKDKNLFLLDDFFIYGKSFHRDKNVNSYLYKHLGANIKLGYKKDRHIFIYNYVIIYNFFFENRFGFSILDHFLGKKMEKKYFKPDGEKLFKSSFLENKTFYTEKEILLYSDLISNLLKNKNFNEDKFILLKYIIYKFLYLPFGTTGKKWNYTILNKNNNTDIDYSILKSEIDEDNIDIDTFLNDILKLNLSFFDELLLSDLLGNVFNIIDMKFNIKNNYSFNKLSAGEKIIFLRFSNIYMTIIEEFQELKNKLKKEGKTEEEINKTIFYTTILIDEPDLHLHLDWQKQYIQKLIDVFSTLDTNIKLHFIIATHSPFIISDLPNESIVVLDGGEKNKYGGKYTEIKKYKNKTFGANFVDIINDGFFFEKKVLMGSFAEKNIKKLSQVYKTKMLLESYSINNNNFEENKDLINSLLKKSEIINKDIQDFKEYEEKIKLFDKLERIKENIGDNFLRENLLYL